MPDFSSAIQTPPKRRLRRADRAAAAFEVSRWGVGTCSPPRETPFVDRGSRPRLVEHTGSLAIASKLAR